MQAVKDSPEVFERNISKRFAIRRTIGNPDIVQMQRVCCNLFYPV